MHTKLLTNKTIQIIFQIFLVMLLWQCSKEDSTELKNDSLEITIKNSEVYQYDFNISGDEEGAVITQQAKHAVRSEIVRDETTNWSVVYVYQPDGNYTGVDSVEIETCTGGDGSINSCNTDTFKLIFQVENQAER